MNSPLTSALHYSKSLGWSVLPCFSVSNGICTCPSGSECKSPGKHPRIAGGLRSASNDPKRILTWWGSNPEDNIGILMGGTTGIFALDIDFRHEGDKSLSNLERTYGKLPDTLVALTGGGRHIFFKHPGGHVTSTTNLRPGIDIRGDGSYVVASPSRHSSGRLYRWASNTLPEISQVAKAPEWLLALIFNPKEKQFGSFKLPEGIPDGQRNDTLFRLASSLKAKGATETEIFSSLSSVNANRANPPLKESELLEIVHSVNRYPAGPRNDQKDLGPPMPLYRTVEDPTAYPLSALGPILGGVAERFLKVIKGPDSICATSVLATANFVTQAHRDVLNDGRVHPLSGFFVSIAESGERKSAIDKEALKPVMEYQRTLIEKHSFEMQDYTNELEAYQGKRRQIIGKKGKTKGDLKTELDSLGPPPEQPLHPILLCEEPTYEGLIKLLEKGQPSLGIFSDEGGRLIGGHAMSDDNQLKTASGFSTLWDGKDSNRVRSGDGASMQLGRRTSINIMIQNAVAQIFYGNGLLQSQGLLSRFLPAWPQSKAGTRMYESVDLEEDAAVTAYRKRVTEILSVPFPLAPGKRNQLNPRPILLSPEAKSEWVRFHDSIEVQLGEGGKLAPVRGFGSKTPEHALRIAGTLALFDNINASTIPLTEMEAGIEIVRFHLSELLRIAEASKIDETLGQAQKLLNWAQKFEVIYLRKIYHDGPSGIRDKSTATKLVRVLEDHGWLIRTEPTNVDGSFRREVWRVIR